MVRRVFFSFHYERDIWRANQVRNSWVTKPNRESAGFWDASLWEDAKTKGEAVIKKMIDEGLKNTSVTAVLIGYETSSRKYVNYEIIQSFNRGNGILGIYINQLKDKYGYSDPKGKNPLDLILTTKNQPLSIYYFTYDWVNNDGYNHFADWVETAASRAGK